MSQLPLPPRLARILVEGSGDPDVALACAVLSERHIVRGGQASTTSDLLSAIDAPHTLPNAVVQLARRLSSLIEESGRTDLWPP